MSTQVNAFLGSVANSVVFTLLVKVICPPPLECDLDAVDPWRRGKQQKKNVIGLFLISNWACFVYRPDYPASGQYVYPGLFRKVCSLNANIGYGSLLTKVRFLIAEINNRAENLYSYSHKLRLLGNITGICIFTQFLGQYYVITSKHLYHSTIVN